MQCFLNPLYDVKDEVISDLHQSLLKITNSQEKADNYYKMVLTADFRKSFGDWTDASEHEGMAGRILPSGEPMLKQNKLGAYYFQMNGGNRHFINNQILEYSYEQRKSLISTTIAYLLEDDVTSKADIETIDFNKLYNNDDNTNAAYVLLDGNRAALQELENITKQYIGLLAYKTEDKEDLMDNGVEVSEAESDRLLDLRQSFEKNSKDNATANIKFLLSFVPEMNKEGELKAVEFDLDGEQVPLLTYYDFNELWTTFEETLSNMYPQFNGGYAVDLFDSMLEKMRETYPDNPTVGYLVNEGGLLSDLPEYKRNQFVQAFLKSKVNFYTTTVKGLGGKLTFKIFNSGDVTSRVKKIRTELASSIQHNEKLINNQTNKVDFDAIKKIEEDFEKEFNRLIYEVKDNITVGETVDAVNTVLKKLGVYVNENSIKAYINSIDSEQGIMGNTEQVLLKTKYLIDTIANKDLFKDKKFNTKLITSEPIIERLASFEEKFRKDVAENTVLGANNKKYWTYSLPGYLNVKLDEYKKGQIQNNGPWYKGSLLKARFKSPEFLEKFNILTFLNLRRDDGDEGVDNKSIAFNDQYIDMFNKSVMSQAVNNDATKSARYGYNIFNTLSPADKGRMMGMQSNLFVASQVKVTPNGYEFSEELVSTYKMYLKSELARITDEFDTFKEYQNASDEDKRVMERSFYNHYNYKKGKLSKTFTSGQFEGRTIPIGNAFKFTLFEELNIDLDNPNDITELQQEIFNISDEGDLMDTIVTDVEEFLNTKQINELVNNKLTSLLNDTVNRLQDKKLISVSKNAEGLIENINIDQIADSSIIDGYINQGYNTDQAALQAVTDSIFNQHIHNIEYGKMFTGDPAYYKDLTDYSKRIPATYIDGVMLNTKEGDEEFYNMIVLPEVIVDGLSKKDGGAGYKNVDINDAQGYITLDRWKFLMERLNKWNPKYEESYERMVAGTSTAEDHKYTAQPLKGVYFDVIDGVPTYVKYSQAVLIPKVIAGTNLQKLHDNMVSNDIQEAVALSGVKVGAVTTSDVLDENKLFKDKMNLIPQQLKNKGWRLQQDLTPKGVKATLIGSQIKKNIIQNIEPNKTYGGIKGSDIVLNIEEIYKDLSNLGLERLQKEIGLDAQGEISNREKFAELLLEEAKRNADINLITALKNEYALDTIVNNSRYQPLIASMINSATIKIKSNGASYIQMSAHAWDIEDAKANGVTMLIDDADFKKLAPPRTKLVNGKKVVQPGQVFVTHQQIAKHIPGYEKMSPSDLKKIIDDKLRFMIGYRIPNQDLASSDALEIVGILPEGMGDTMVPYVEITAKTGSDFDIDKMYAMLPNMVPKVRNTLNGKETYRLEFLDETNSKNKSEILGNKLIDAYRHILTSPEKFGDLMASLDNNTLRDGLAELHDINNKPDGFKFFSSLFQLEKKFANAAGKTGTGIISNHLVDQTYTQISNFTMAGDLGVGKFKDGYTYFNNIKDVDNKNKISQVLSWFLTAFVDIAKDPYITIGNYNVVTTGLSAMLIRAGAPLSWVSSYIGQPILKQYAEMEMNKDSRILEDYTSTDETINDELIASLKELPDFVDNNAALEKFLIDNEVVNPRTDALFKEENLVKAMKRNDPREQYKIYQVFKGHVEASRDFEQTVNLSKADVNGAKSTVIENIMYEHKLDKLYAKTDAFQRAIFPQLVSKFNTYLGTAHDNSISLVNRINKKEFLVGKNRNLVTDYLDMKPYASNKEMEAFASAMNTFTISKNRFFHVENEEMDYLLKGKFQDDILTAKVNYPDNILLQSLEPNSEEDFKFVDMENISNRPPNFKDDLIRGWEQLLKDDRELGENLIKYSYVTSGFKFGMKTFYEFIPANTYKVLVEPAYNEYKNVFPETFLNFFYRHNADYAPRFAREGEDKPQALDGKLYARRLLTVPSKDTLAPPYMSEKVKGKKEPNLYKLVNVDTARGKNVYALMPKLGNKVGTRNIIEPSMPEFSQYDTTDGQSKAYKNALEYIKEASITNLDYKQITKAENINYNMLKFSEGDFSDDTNNEFEEQC